MNEIPSSLGLNEDIDPSSGARVVIPEGSSILQGEDLGISGGIIQNERPRLPDEDGVFLSSEKNEDMWRVDPLDTIQEVPIEASIDTAQFVGGQDLAVDRRIESIPGQVSADKSPGEAGADDAMSISELLNKRSSSTPLIVEDTGEKNESSLEGAVATEPFDIDDLREESKGISAELEHRIEDTQERFEDFLGKIAAQEKEILEEAEDLVRVAATEISEAEKRRDEEKQELISRRKQLEIEEGEIDRRFDEIVQRSNLILERSHEIIEGHKRR